MKRFLCILAVMFLAAGLFAAPKLTEKQVEDFIEKGSYIKEVIYRNSKVSHINYYLKENFFKILIDETQIQIFNDNIEKIVYFDFNEYDVTVDEKGNIITTYKF